MGFAEKLFQMRLQYVPILFLSGFGLAAQELHDFRMVSGIEVDLAPVNNWLSAHKGERPMKHWQQIQIIEVKSCVGTWDLCQVKNESGQALDLYVENVPAEIKEFLGDLAQQQRAIAALTRQISLDKQTKEAAWNRYMKKDSPAYRITSDSRGLSCDTEATRQADAKAIRQKLKNEQEQLRKLNAAYERDSHLAQQRITTLAMFTGRKYGGVEIWDCGKRK